MSIPGTEEQVVDPAGSPQVPPEDDVVGTDPGAEEGSPSESRKLSPRDEMIQEIAVAWQKLRPEVDGESEPPDPEDLVEEPGQVQTDDDEPPATVEVTPAQEDLVEAVVDGKKMSFPKDKVFDTGLRTLQKETSADHKLQEASELLKTLREQTEKLKTADPAPAVQRAATPPETQAQEVEPDWGSLAHRLQFGDPEDAAEALKELTVSVSKMRGVGQRQEASTDQIKQLVHTEIETRDRARTHEEIRSKFQRPVAEGGFEDIYQDPHLLQVTNQRVSTMLRDGSTDTWETYRQAGEQTRQWLRQIAGTQGLGDTAQAATPGAQQSGTSLAEKEARKRAVAAVPRPSGSVVTPNTPPPRPKTREETLEEIRRSRGQAVS